MTPFSSFHLGSGLRSPRNFERSAPSKSTRASEGGPPTGPGLTTGGSGSAAAGRAEAQAARINPAAAARRAGRLKQEGVFIRALRSGLEAPALAVGRVDEGVGRLVVGEARLGVVPLEFLARVTNGNGPEQRRLGERAAVTEVGAGLAPGADGLDPVPGVALDAGNLFCRGVLAGVLVGQLVGEEPATAAAVGAVHDHAFVAKENGADARGFLVARELGGFGDAGVAVVPDELDGAAFFAGGELEGDLGPGGEGQSLLDWIIVDDLGLDGGRSVQVQRPEGGIDDVAEPVAHGPGAEGHPAAPVPRNPHRGVGPEGHGPQPQIVVKAFGGFIRFGELFQVAQLAIDVFEGVATGMDGMDLADGSRPDPFADAADGPAGMALVAQLRDDLVLGGRGHESAHLLDGVGQRFFAIDVFAAAHGFHGNDRVGVVGSADDDRVNLLAHLVEHDAVILEPFGLGILGELLGGVVVVHVAEGDEVLAFARDGVDVGAALAADADSGDVEFVVEQGAVRARAGEKVEQGDSRAGAEKLPSVHHRAVLFAVWLLGSSSILPDSGWPCKICCFPF